MRFWEISDNSWFYEMIKKQDKEIKNNSLIKITLIRINTMSLPKDIFIKIKGGNNVGKTIIKG